MCQPLRHVRQVSIISFFILHHFIWSTVANILSDSDLAIQRGCVRNCFGHNYNIALWDAVGCPDNDSCMCRPDLRASASNRLSYCILTYYKTCSDGTDIAIATSIFNRFCSFTAPATVFVTPTPSVAAQSDAGPVTVTIPASAPITKTLFTSAPTVTILSSRPESSGTRARAMDVPVSILATAVLTTTLYLFAFPA